MNLGITGLAFSGKSTVFGALTFSRGAPEAETRSRAANLRRVLVPDQRLSKLREIFKPKKFTPATVEYTDLPGFGGKDAFFASLRDLDALVLVVRGFENDSVPHSQGNVDPVRDLQELVSELALSDLVPVESRIDRLETSLRKNKAQDTDKAELEVLKELRAILEQGLPLHGHELPEASEKLIRSFGFLTRKPWLIVNNIGDDDDPADATLCEKAGLTMVPGRMLETALRGRLERELCALDEDERAEFMADLGIDELAGEKVIRLSYEVLDRISMLTAGDKEVRAWTIPRVNTAPQAAGTIHSDMERGFIRAEVVGWEDFEELGSLPAARAKGKARLEGKTYVVQDGDVVEIRFNV